MDVARFGVIAAAVAIVVLTAPSARADFKADQELCNGTSDDLDGRVAACTRQIKSGRWEGHNLAVSYSNRGNAYQLKGDLDHAFPDYDEAIRLDPNNPINHFNRALAFRAQGDLDGAIADYNDAIRLNPRYAVAYNNRGLAYRAKGDFDRAIADYTAAIKINPLPQNDKKVNVYFNRGLAYRAKGDLDAAIADFTAAIRLDPDSVGSYNSRGLALRAEGDTQRAIADFTTAIRINPKDPFLYFNRALANVYASSLPQALSDLNKASELDPKYAYTALWLDIVNKRSNQPSHLADAIGQIDMDQWPAPIIRFYLGQLSREQVLAAADITNAETRKGQICEANFYAGELAEQQGNKDEAKRLFGLAAANCPRTFIEYAAAVDELKALGR